MVDRYANIFLRNEVGGWNPKLEISSCLYFRTQNIYYYLNRCYIKNYKLFDDDKKDIRI